MNLIGIFLLNTLEICIKYTKYLKWTKNYFVPLEKWYGTLSFDMYTYTKQGKRPIN
jgi:hypothetical protein